MKKFLLENHAGHQFEQEGKNLKDAKTKLCLRLGNDPADKETGVDSVKVINQAAPTKEKWFRALVKDKQTKETITIERKYASKAKFAEDLRGNGYAVKVIVPAEDIIRIPEMVARYDRWAEDGYHIDGPWSDGYDLTKKEAAQEVPVLEQLSGENKGFYSRPLSQSVRDKLLDMIEGKSKLLTLEELTVQFDAYVETHFPKIQSAQA